MAHPKQGSEDAAEDEAPTAVDDDGVIVLTFPVPREAESEPPELDPDETPTILPSNADAEVRLRAGIDDRATEPPEESPTEPPPYDASTETEDMPTKPPEEPTTLVPPASRLSPGNGSGRRPP